MLTHDIHGRPYAKLSQLAPGDKVTCDDGFTCLRSWVTRTVRADHNGLFIPCSEGRHYLIGFGQLDDHSDALIGIYCAPIERA